MGPALLLGPIYPNRSRRVSVYFERFISWAHSYPILKKTGTSYLKGWALGSQFLLHPSSAINQRQIFFAGFNFKIPHVAVSFRLNAEYH